MDQFGDWRACRNEGSDVEFLIENEEHYINVPHYTAWRLIQTCRNKFQVRYRINMGQKQQMLQIIIFNMQEKLLFNLYLY